MNDGFMERSCAESQNGDTHQRHGSNPEGTATFQTLKEYIMLNRYKKAAIIIALTGATALSGLTYAQERSPAAGATTPTVAQSVETARNSPQDAWLNLGQIYDKLLAAGYTDVREIERESGGYEAKARDPEGRVVKLHMEPLEGRIVDERVRDREDRRDRDDRREHHRDRG